ncbi:MAG: hypothetical protein L0Y44_10665 [Phycisphaerales bacterium]|nr:hypothetical protein [Phycisphaerales bacterium]MCI0631100.1 hypothetical protein [Phycisphaerales bacterium]MCI0675442.1 hypothetical protein [Phycisphaerales bacterium]
MLNANVRKVFFWSTLVASCLGMPALSGCHTTEGAGEDIEDLGDEIEDIDDDDWDD